MKALILYECRKVFQNKLIPMLLLFLLLFNGLMIYRNAVVAGSKLYTSSQASQLYDQISELNNEEKYEEIYRLYQRVRAVQLIEKIALNSEFEEFITDEERDMIQSLDRIDHKTILTYTENIYAEEALLRDTMDQIEVVINYQDYLSSIDKQAKTMTSSSLFSEPGSFSYRNIQKTVKAYEPLKNNTLLAEKSEGVKAITQNPVSSVVSLLIIVLLSMSMITSEREDGYLPLIKSTKKGHEETIKAKICALLLMTTICELLLYSSGLLISNHLLGFGDLSRLIQSLDGYIECPFSITVGQYLLLFLALKIIIAYALALFMFFFYVKLRNGVFACLGIVGILLIEFTFFNLIDLHSWLSPLKIINIANFFDATTFFRLYQNMNLFGYPVNVIPICFLFMVFIMGISITGIIYTYCNESIIDSRKLLSADRIGKRCKRRKSPVIANLFLQECYKLFFKQKAIFILITFFVFQWFIYKDVQGSKGAEEWYYQQYMDIVGGAITPDTAAYLRSEQKELQDTEIQLNSLQNLNADSETDQKLYQELQRQSIKKSALDKVIEQYNYVLELNRSGTEAELVYETGYDKLFNETGERQDVIAAGELAFVLILGLSAVMSVEKQTHVKLLIITSTKGMKACRAAKVKACWLYGFLALIIAFLPRYLYIFNEYGTQGMTASVYSIRSLGEVSIPISISTYILLVNGCRLLGMIIMVLVILLISERSGNMITTILFGMVVLLLPVFIYLIGVLGQTFLSLLPLATSYSILKITGETIIYLSIILGTGAIGYIAFLME